MDAFIQLWQAGGPMLWVLALMSIIGAFCFLERLLYLRKCTVARASFTSGLFNLVEKGRLLEALTVCQENPGPIPPVMRAGLLKFKESSDRIAASMREAALLQVPLLERRISTLNWIAKMAPLVGLLGTTIPLVDAFLAMSAEGPYSSSDLFIGQVGEALITTAAGLLLALMAMSSWYWVDGKVRALLQEMELAAAELIEFRLKMELNPEPERVARSE
ncbi:MAG: MotA/TolQ/ExbB proton channel family protein [Verrucomicrobiota bacterium]